jgi:hypothetical protein
MSNDADKLYLTFQATDLDIINKIIRHGITLTINGSGKMNDQGGIAITFPALVEKGFPHNNIAPVNLDKPELMQTASFIEMINTQLVSETKNIKIAGINGVKDTISIYNPEGIMAAALFDANGVFTSELAVPLKHLGLSVNEQKSFVYNIKLNGGTGFRKEITAGITSLKVENSSLVFGGPTAETAQSLFSPTDFRAEYTLAK